MNVWSATACDNRLFHVHWNTTTKFDGLCLRVADSRNLTYAYSVLQFTIGGIGNCWVLLCKILWFAGRAPRTLLLYCCMLFLAWCFTSLNNWTLTACLAVAGRLTLASEATTATTAIVTTSNETDVEKEPEEGIDLGLVIGLAVGLAALALAVIILAILLARRRKKPREEDKPRQSIAFYQAVRAARPAYLAQNGKKNPPWMSAHNRPRMSYYRPGCIDNPVYDFYCNSAGCYAPRYTHRCVTY